MRGIRKNPVYAAPWLILISIISIEKANSQDWDWNFSGSGGFGFARLGSVNETLDRTVSYWNTAEGVPVGPFQHFSSSPLWSLRLWYRYERDFAFSVSVGKFTQTVRNDYRDVDYILEMERTIGATDATVGIAYFFPPVFESVDLNVIVEFGETFATADATTYGAKSRKVGIDYVWDVTYDTIAHYHKSKLILNAGVGADADITGRFFAHSEVLYKFAKLGQMDGEIQRISGSFPEPTVTEFDFSALSLRVGLGIRF